MKRHNRYPGRGSGTGFSVFIIIIILAVAVGYAGTKYIIFPYLLGNNPIEKTEDPADGDKVTTETGINITPSAPSIIIDQQNIKDQTTGSAVISGAADAVPNTNDNLKGPFSVQFGSFSTETGADAFSTELASKGIYSYVYESNNSYKVLGLPYSSEEKAKEAASVVSVVVADVFVVNLSSLIQ